MYSASQAYIHEIYLDRSLHNAMIQSELGIHVAYDDHQLMQTCTDMMADAVPAQSDSLSWVRHVTHRLALRAFIGRSHLRIPLITTQDSADASSLFRQRFKSFTQERHVKGNRNQIISLPEALSIQFPSADEPTTFFSRHLEFRQLKPI